jgi:hypothetical protein
MLEQVKRTNRGMIQVVVDLGWRAMDGDGFIRESAVYVNLGRRSENRIRNGRGSRNEGIPNRLTAINAQPLNDRRADHIRVDALALVDDPKLLRRRTSRHGSA